MILHKSNTDLRLVHVDLSGDLTILSILCVATAKSKWSAVLAPYESSLRAVCNLYPADQQCLKVDVLTTILRWCPVLRREENHQTPVNFLKRASVGLY